MGKYSSIRICLRTEEISTLLPRRESYEKKLDTLPPLSLQSDPEQDGSKPQALSVLCLPTERMHAGLLSTPLLAQQDRPGHASLGD